MRAVTREEGVSDALQHDWRPKEKERRLTKTRLAYRWLGVTHKGLHGRRGLEVRGQDHGVFAQVKGESLPCPTTLGLHHLERYTTEEVLEGPSDAQAVSFDVWEVGTFGQCSEFRHELVTTEGVELPIGVLPGEQMV